MPGTKHEVVLPTYRVQFLIPLPTGKHLAVLDVSTTSEQAGQPWLATQSPSRAA